MQGMQAFYRSLLDSKTASLEGKLKYAFILWKCQRESQHLKKDFRSLVSSQKLDSAYMKQ